MKKQIIIFLCLFFSLSVYSSARLLNIDLYPKSEDMKTEETEDNLDLIYKENISNISKTDAIRLAKNYVNDHRGCKIHSYAPVYTTNRSISYIFIIEKNKSLHILFITPEGIVLDPVKLNPVK